MKPAVKIEYAKSGRAGCKGCKSPIAEKTMRVAKMVQSPFFDGLMPYWFHVGCFFGPRMKFEYTITEFEGHEKLKPADLLRLGGYLSNNNSNAPVPSPNVAPTAEATEGTNANAKGRKRKTSAATKVKQHASVSAAATNANASSLVGMRDIIAQNAALTANLTRVTSGNADGWDKLLRHNGMYIWDGLTKNDRRDLLADIMTFGVPHPCPVCESSGTVRFQRSRFACYHESDYGRCTYESATHGSGPFKIPKKPTSAMGDLADYTFVQHHRASAALHAQDARTRALNDLSFVLVTSKRGSAATAFKQEWEERIRRAGGSVAPALGPLVTAVICEDSTTLTKMAAARKKTIHQYALSVFACTALEQALRLGEWKPELPSMSTHLLLKGNKAAGGVEEEEISEMGSIGSTHYSGRGMDTVDQHCEYRSSHQVADAVVGGSRRPFSAAMSKVDRTTNRNSFYILQALAPLRAGRCDHILWMRWGRTGTTIGGSSEQVFEEKEELLEAFRQKFEEKTGNTFGSVPTARGGGFFTVVETDHHSRKEGHVLPAATAVKVKDGAKDNVKVEGNDGVDEEGMKLNSLLPTQVADVVSMIFDQSLAGEALKEFNIDITKMPLGSLSLSQITRGFSCLTEISELFTAYRTEVTPPASRGRGRGRKKGAAAKQKPRMSEEVFQGRLALLSNKFYTIIPHSFGRNIPPLLDSDAMLKEKIELLENLREMVEAEQMRRTVESGIGQGNLLGARYHELQCAMEVVALDSQEGRLILEYVQKTHGPTHNAYTLSVISILKVSRHGERERFQSYESLENQQLLWHGSRTTNFGGILKQGLRIAPPEAPVTGYMFGKGIYFADMVTKSANYCFASPDHPFGLMLLSQVALGKMKEVTMATTFDRKSLPNNFGSVKGVGSMLPNPQTHSQLSDGVHVPIGLPHKAPVTNTSLLYNEYIVYDEAQVQMRYLLHVRFDYDSSRKRMRL
jgi:poly [ADP-ribose] polymerase 1